MKVAKSILELVGNTPIVQLNRVTSGLKAKIFAKCEFLNPTGSVKDRIALYMIEQAEKKKIINKDTTIVEATTGNTGIALSWVAAVKGYKTLVIMPEGMSEERKKIMQSFGADISYTSGSESDVSEAINKANEIVNKNKNYWLAGQFVNEDNVEAHRRTTGKEIIKQIKKIDAFVAGIGTGGTITGVAKVLKKKNKKIKIVAVEPMENAILSGGKRGKHRIEGIGDGIIPEILDMKLIDEVIAISDENAIKMAKRLAREEGLLVGISSGCNVCASIEVAEKIGKGNIVTLLPDSGQRYFSTDLFK
ncbi:MAG: cysteine synthase A [Candidatus Thermoplasmatota archaeon]